MSEPFVGEIRMFSGNFAPRGWAFCDGQLLSVSENDALFSLLGTIYGGDGRTTFGLPDLRGRLPIHAGSGPGLSDRRLGAKGGAENVTITENHLPSHSHQAQGTNDIAEATDPAGMLAGQSTTISPYVNVAPTVSFNNEAVSYSGGGQHHNNIMPFLCINFIIALIGVYPSRH